MSASPVRSPQEARQWRRVVAVRTPPSVAAIAVDAPDERRTDERPHDQGSVSVVVPVYNGGARLDPCLRQLKDWMEASLPAHELVLVDDGSGDDTLVRLEAFAASRSDVRVLRLAANEGKGGAIRSGMAAATGDYRVFLDADLAYPPEEIDTLLDALREGADVAIACRVLPASRYLMSPAFFPYLFSRHVVSRCWNLLVRLFLVPGVLDTQAGLKGFTGEAATKIFPRLTIRRFGFDIECLHLASRHGLRITQCPVYFRYDEEPTTVAFLRDSLRMLRDLTRVRLNGWRGRYD